jgi:ADP-ribosylglycohydrolase
MKANSIVHAGIFGLAIGDALGVPVEFQSRVQLQKNPVKDMRGFGTHHQLPGTWSDDSSLTFCLAESLCVGYDLEDIAQSFLKWYHAEIWTPYGKVFDIGIATTSAIRQIANGIGPVLCGGDKEQDNGNGSLMRILPLAFYLKDETDLQIIFDKVKEVSSITHAHFRSVFACFIYVFYAGALIKGDNKIEAYYATRAQIQLFIRQNSFEADEIQWFQRVIFENIAELREEEIFSSGYVIHSLEASLWCLLNSDSFEETVLRAVNLGEDTDTTAAIAGGLAGIAYGWEMIPEKWKSILARVEDIEVVCNQLSDSLLRR